MFGFSIGGPTDELHPFTKSSETGLGKPLTCLPCLVVYVQFQFVYTTTKSKWAVRFCWLPPVLTFNCDGDLKKAFNDCPSKEGCRGRHVEAATMTPIDEVEIMWIDIQQVHSGMACRSFQLGENGSVCRSWAVACAPKLGLTSTRLCILHLTLLPVARCLCIITHPRFQFNGPLRHSSIPPFSCWCNFMHYSRLVALQFNPDMCVSAFAVVKMQIAYTGIFAHPIMWAKQY